MTHTFKLWQCVTANKHAGYIYNYKTSGPRKGKYAVSIPSKQRSIYVSGENLQPRDCSKSMEERIREHKKMLLRLGLLDSSTVAKKKTGPKKAKKKTARKTKPKNTAPKKTVAKKPKKRI